jgi:hypothetical protein
MFDGGGAGMIRGTIALILVGGSTRVISELPALLADGGGALGVFASPAGVCVLGGELVLVMPGRSFCMTICFLFMDTSSGSSTVLWCLTDGVDG